MEGGSVYKNAFADQVEQKIIPKLRGIDLNESNSRLCLDGILQVISELGASNRNLVEAFSKSKDDQSTGTFIWRGISQPTDA